MTFSTHPRIATPAMECPSPEQVRQEWIDLQQLVDRCLGNLELADRLIARFRERVAETALSLRQARDHEDIEAIGRLAHRLMGESANLGSATLSRLAGELESAATEDRKQDIPAIAEQLLRACEQFSENVFTFGELSNHEPDGSSTTGRPPDSGRPER